MQEAIHLIFILIFPDAVAFIVLAAIVALLAYISTSGTRKTFKMWQFTL